MRSNKTAQQGIGIPHVSKKYDEKQMTTESNSDGIAAELDIIRLPESYVADTNSKVIASDTVFRHCYTNGTIHRLKPNTTLHWDRMQINFEDAQIIDTITHKKKQKTENREALEIQKTSVEPLIYLSKLQQQFVRALNHQQPSKGS